MWPRLGPRPRICVLVKLCCSKQVQHAVTLPLSGTLIFNLNNELCNTFLRGDLRIKNVNISLEFLCRVLRVQNSLRAVLRQSVIGVLSAFGARADTSK